MLDDSVCTQAENIIGSLCGCIDRCGWVYKRNDDLHAVSFTVYGEDIPIDIIVYVNEENSLIRVLSPLARRFPEQRRLDGAVAVSVANHALTDGYFDYDITDGTISFRVSASYRDGDIGDRLFGYLITLTCGVVDHYNDKFLALSEGTVSISEILDSF